MATPFAPPLHDPAFHAGDPFPVFRRLRVESPVHWHDTPGFWALTRHDDVLAVSRMQEGPERWACQRALTVHSNVAVDVEACSLDGPTSAAAAIAGQIAQRLPAA